jgi:vacuolar-type H+-ATPase subunit E/Vma4
VFDMIRGTVRGGKISSRVALSLQEIVNSMLSHDIILFFSDTVYILNEITAFSIMQCVKLGESTNYQGAVIESLKSGLVDLLNELATRLEVIDETKNEAEETVEQIIEAYPTWLKELADDHPEMQGQHPAFWAEHAIAKVQQDIIDLLETRNKMDASVIRPVVSNQLQEMLDEFGTRV